MKLCAICGEWPKRAGHPKWCNECWLERQPIQMQVQAAKRRTESIPESLRLARVPEREWPPGRRWCAGCQTFVRFADTRGSRCKPCASASAHASKLKSTYTIGGRPFTAEDYDALFRAQGGRCALCRRETKSRRFAVDHDHESGEVRGLLCSDPEWGCNLKILPRFDADDDPVAMAQRLVDYLMEPPARKHLTGR